MSTPTTQIKIGNTTVDASTVTKPTDRVFRDAWSLSGNVVSVDMAAAREIQKDRIRADRAPRMAALDAKWFEATEKGDTATQSAVAAEKNALRAATERIEIASAATPGALAALTLAALVPRN